MSEIPQLGHYSRSWIVTSKATGEVVLETYQRSVAEKVNQDKYRVETALQYLARFNNESKEQK